MRAKLEKGTEGVYPIHNQLLTVYPLYLNRLLGVYGNFSGCMENTQWAHGLSKQIESGHFCRRRVIPYYPMLV